VTSTGTVQKPPFFASLPERFTASPNDPQQLALLEAVADRGEIDWFMLDKTSKDGIRLRLPITNAVKVDGVRINLRYDIAQRLADRMGVLLPTPKVADMVQAQATCRLSPQGLTQQMQNHVIAGTNTGVTAMVEHSALVDKALQGCKGLTNNEGKWFVLSKLFWTAAGQIKSGIYGWWRDNGQIIQSNILAHELPFSDYSQVIRFMGPTVVVTLPGEVSFDMPTSEMLTSDKFASLISYEGALPGSRHPNVPLAIATA
jgi:hypothetical protein